MGNAPFAEAAEAVPLSVEQRRSLTAQAKAFLLAALAVGPRRAGDLFREAEQVGIPAWALTDARQALRIASHKLPGFGKAGGWQWALTSAQRRHKKQPRDAIAAN
jgi:hypothetical protein